MEGFLEVPIEDFFWGPFPVRASLAELILLRGLTTFSIQIGLRRLHLHKNYYYSLSYLSVLLVSSLSLDPSRVESPFSCLFPSLINSLFWATVGPIQPLF